MLVRDIQLLDAIIDLVDNSVDAARKLRPPSTSGPRNERYAGLSIELTMNRAEFRINDNCGGIDAEVAQKYAFNFGRQDDAPRVEGSVGQFGVGMKRALFKLGNHFCIESRAARSSFVVDVDVPAWERGKENPWNFEFKDYQPTLAATTPAKKRHTKIVVNQLHAGVADQLALERMESELSVTISRQHEASLDLGLEIRINGTTVNRRRPLLLLSSDITPIHQKFQIEVDGGNAEPVEAEIFVGLSNSGEAATAGWYVYCNDRLVVNADKSALTGWGRAAGGTIPAYHPQFRRFRGYAFLQGDDPNVLPWNTTKTSLDANSLVYRALMERMIPAMQQVISFITEADNEFDAHPRGGGPLNKAINSASSVALSAVPVREKLEVKVTPKRKRQPKTTVSVQYHVERQRLDEVRESLGLTSASQVGLATFDYYYEAEVE